MTRPRPDPAPRARGFLRAWVSGARLWSATTKSLLDKKGLGGSYMAMVALYLCVKEACLLNDGNEHGDVPGDDVARADCPIAPRELRKVRDRLQGFRDEVLHLSDKSEEGRALHTSYTADPPYFVFRSSVGRKTMDFDEISKPEIEGLLATLDPWLDRHWERLVHEEDTPEKTAALAAKIDATMRALDGS